MQTRLLTWTWPFFAKLVLKLMAILAPFPTKFEVKSDGRFITGEVIKSSQLSIMLHDEQNQEDEEEDEEDTIMGRVHVPPDSYIVVVDEGDDPVEYCCTKPQSFSVVGVICPMKSENRAELLPSAFNSAAPSTIAQCNIPCLAVAAADFRSSSFATIYISHQRDDKHSETDEPTPESNCHSGTDEAVGEEAAAGEAATDEGNNNDNDEDGGSQAAAKRKRMVATTGHLLVKTAKNLDSLKKALWQRQPTWFAKSEAELHCVKNFMQKKGP